MGEIKWASPSSIHYDGSGAAWLGYTSLEDKKEEFPFP